MNGMGFVIVGSSSILKNVSEFIVIILLEILINVAIEWMPFIITSSVLNSNHFTPTSSEIEMTQI